jgi:2-methylcitrate dehydratase PrpD
VGYCVALAACGADVILPQHSTDFETQLRRPEIGSVLANIEVVADPALTHYHQCSITVSCDGANVHEASLAGPRGSPQNPLGDAEVIAKFQRLAAHRLDEQASATYAARFLQLEREADCHWIFDALIAS